MGMHIFGVPGERLLKSLSKRQLAQQFIFLLGHLNMRLYACLVAYGYFHQNKCKPICKGLEPFRTSKRSRNSISNPQLGAFKEVLSQILPSHLDTSQDTVQ
jgi:hypothetical protein